MVMSLWPRFFAHPVRFVGKSVIIRTFSSGTSERFRKWGGYKFVRTLYNLVVKVVFLKF